MYKLLLCQRYLRSRYIALASIISVTLGVATMIVVNAVMAGFSSEMRTRIQGILSDIIIETRNYDGEADSAMHKELVQRLIGQYVAGVTTTVEVYGMLSFQYGGQYIHHPVTLIGIDPGSKSEVGPLVDYLQSYHRQENGGEVTEAERPLNQRPDWSLTPAATEHRKRIAGLARNNAELLRQIKQQRHGDDAEAPPTATDAGAGEDPDPFGGMVRQPNEPQAAEAVLGELQTGRLYIGGNLISFPHKDETTGQTRIISMVRPGDDVKISTVSAGTPSPKYFDATVVDVFKSGMSEYDSNLVFCNLEHLQRVRQMIQTNPDGTESSAITSVQIKLKDYRDSDKVLEILRSEFPPDRYTVRTGEQKQGPLLAAVDVIVDPEHSAVPDHHRRRLRHPGDLLHDRRREDARHRHPEGAGGQFLGRDVDLPELRPVAGNGRQRRRSDRRTAVRPLHQPDRSGDHGADGQKSLRREDLLLQRDSDSRRSVHDLLGRAGSDGDRGPRQCVASPPRRAIAAGPGSALRVIVHRFALSTNH